MIVYFLATMELGVQMAARIIHSIKGRTVYKHHAQNVFYPGSLPVANEK